MANILFMEGSNTPTPLEETGKGSNTPSPLEETGKGSNTPTPMEETGNSSSKSRGHKRELSSGEMPQEKKLNISEILETRTNRAEVTASSSTAAASSRGSNYKDLGDLMSKLKVKKIPYEFLIAHDKEQIMDDL
jgi:hypothetical protein